MAHRRIFITSSKGGVGKSTVCANLAYAFASKGKRTLVIDLDLSNRSLDMLFGCDDAVLYDLGDLIDGTCSPRDAIIRRGRSLYVIPGYAVCEKTPTVEAFERALSRAERCARADVTLIDTSGSADGSARLAAAVASTALIVSNESAISLRAAESSAVLLGARAPHLSRYLVINRFHMSLFKSGTAPLPSEMIDRTRLPIIGIVPHSDHMAREQEYGRLVYDSAARDNCKAAFSNVARRLLGEQVPLLDGFSRLTHLTRQFLIR